MIDGPCSAPSSPPETPVPMKWMPALASSWLRRMVSLKKVLPPSISTSPLLSSGFSSAITASVPAPACTISRMRRGFSSEATNFSIV